MRNAVCAAFHSVETFGTVDGPGLRYVLFLTGCGLRCGFCHNPDTWVSSGTKISVAEVLEDYRRYRPFYNAAAGGITVSGGEPLLQDAFVRTLFDACQEEKIHTVLDTAGFAPAAAMKRVLARTDLVLFSVKALDQAKHRQLAGQDNQGILRNLREAAFSTSVVIRYVLIPGVTDGEEDLNALARLVRSLPGKPPVELLAYHTLGRSKWDRLGIAYPLAAVRTAHAADLEQARGILQTAGIEIFGDNQAIVRDAPAADIEMATVMN